MRLELNSPENFPKHLVDYFYHIYVRLHKGYQTEVITLDQAIGRRTSQHAIALNEYPTQNLSAFAGWGMKSKITQNILKGQYISINKVYFSDAELYRSRDFYKIDQTENCIIRLPKYIALPSSIDAILHNDDIRLNTEDPNAYKVIETVEKFEGVIKSGSIVQQGECLVKKDEIINAEKVIALARAGLKQIEVYKKPRIVIVSMYSYDNENSISEECLYVRNTLKRWGYPNVEIKILKPIRLEHAFKIYSEQNDPVLNPYLASSQVQFNEEFKTLSQEYDLILVCSVSQNHSGVLTLNKLATFDQSSSTVPVSLNTKNQESLKIFRSADRSPPIKQLIELRDSQGKHKGVTTQITEDKALIINLMGGIDEIMMTMNIGIRYILNRHDPQFIYHHFHRGFMENFELADQLHIQLGQYHQEQSSRFLVEITKQSEQHNLSKYIYSNCIVIIPSSTENKVEDIEVFFIKLD